MVVRRRRDAIGIPQDELARRAGLHRTYVSLVERGKRNPTLEVIQALAAALKTSMTALIDDTEQRGG